MKNIRTGSFFMLIMSGVMLILASPEKLFAFASWQTLTMEYVYGSEYAAHSESIDPATGYSRDDTTPLTTLTLDYVNGWKYGGTYFYVDIIKDDDDVGFFTQGWENLSLNKILKTDKFKFGIVEDVLISIGWQFGNVDDFYAGDVAQGILDSSAWPGMKPVYDAHDTMDIFYGLNLPLKIPGTEFAGVTIGVYDDINSETDYDLQFFMEAYWHSSFYIGPTHWKFEGFIDLYGSRDSGAGALDQQQWLYSQLQLALDVGALLWSRPNQFWIGTEIQWSENLFGMKNVHDGFGYITKEQSEFFPALLVEWVF